MSLYLSNQMLVLETGSICCALRNEFVNVIRVKFRLETTTCLSSLEVASFVFNCFGLRFSCHFYCDWKVEATIGLIYIYIYISCVAEELRWVHK